MRPAERGTEFVAGFVGEVCVCRAFVSGCV